MDGHEKQHALTRASYNSETNIAFFIFRCKERCMQRYRNKLAPRVLLLAVSLTLLQLLSIKNLTAKDKNGKLEHIRHVLLLSIDGMHEQDLARYIQHHPHSALADL